MAGTSPTLDASAIAASSGQRTGRALLLAGRVVLGGIFVYAAYAKLHFAGAWHLRDYHFFFAMAINSYNMLPLAVVQWMAQDFAVVRAGAGYAARSLGSACGG